MASQPLSVPPPCRKSPAGDLGLAPTSSLQPASASPFSGTVTRRRECRSGFHRNREPAHRGKRLPSRASGKGNPGFGIAIRERPVEAINCRLVQQDIHQRLRTSTLGTAERAPCLHLFSLKSTGTREEGQGINKWCRPSLAHSSNAVRGKPGVRGEEGTLRVGGHQSGVLVSSWLRAVAEEAQQGSASAQGSVYRTG